jgi:hypothetical protein
MPTPVGPRGPRHREPAGDRAPRERFPEYENSPGWGYLVGFAGFACCLDDFGEAYAPLFLMNSSL